MTPPANRQQQPLLLDQDKATGLDTLSKRNGVPKQVLLREAVDILLAMEGAPVFAPKVEQMRQRLMKCEWLMSHVSHNKLSEDDIHRACSETLVLIHLVLREQLGALKESRISHGVAKGRRLSTKDA